MAKQVTAFSPLQAGQGEASISTPIDVSQVYDYGMRTKEAEEQKRIAQAKADAEAQAERLNTLTDLDPQKAGEMFVQPATDLAMELYGFNRDLKTGRIEATPENIAKSQEMYSIGELAYAKMNRDSQVYKDKLDFAKSLNKDYYNIDEYKKNIGAYAQVDINEATAGNIEYDLQGNLLREDDNLGKAYYKPFSVAKDWVSDIPEDQVQSEKRVWLDKGNFQNKSMKVQGKFVKIDENGDPVYKNGKVQLDENKLDASMASWLEVEKNAEWIDYAKTLPEYQNENGEPMEDIEIFKSLMQPYLSTSVTENLSAKQKLGESGDGVSTNATNVYRLVDAIQKFTEPAYFNGDIVDEDLLANKDAAIDAIESNFVGSKVDIQPNKIVIDWGGNKQPTEIMTNTQGGGAVQLAKFISKSLPTKEKINEGNIEKVYDEYKKTYTPYKTSVGEEVKISNPEFEQALGEANTGWKYFLGRAGSGVRKTLTDYDIPFTKADSNEITFKSGGKEYTMNFKKLQDEANNGDIGPHTKAWNEMIKLSANKTNTNGAFDTL